MPDQQEVEVLSPQASALSTEIGASLASVWARYFGSRPSEAETKLDTDVVRWVLAQGTSEFKQGMAAEAAEGEAPLPERTMHGYKRDTSAAVAKVTGRKVMAMISKHNAKTGVATETFILETRPIRY
jgi:uncharacterized protein YbcI